MTMKRDECVISSDHVTPSDEMILSDHVTPSVEAIHTDHVTPSDQVIHSNHVTISDITHTGVIHIILSVDEEHLQGMLFIMIMLLSAGLLYRAHRYYKLSIKTFIKSSPLVFSYCDCRPANQIAGILSAMPLPSSARTG